MDWRLRVPICTVDSNVALVLVVRFRIDMANGTFVCRRHAGQANRPAREPYDPIMRDLPRNQSGEEQLARHACAICAYERGREDMRKQIAEWLGVPLDEVPGAGATRA